LLGVTVTLGGIEGKEGELILPYHDVTLLSIPPREPSDEGSVPKVPVEFGMKGGKLVILLGIPPKEISGKVQLEGVVEVKGGGWTLTLVGSPCVENTGKELEDTLVKSGELIDDVFGAKLEEFNVVGMELTGSNVVGIKVIGFNVVGLDVTGATVVGLKVTGAIVVGLNVTGATVVGLKVTGAVVVGLEVIIIGFFVVGDEVRGTFLLVGAQVVTTAGIIVVGILVVGGKDCKGYSCLSVDDAGSVIWK
jgi:hypothetical protein